jgi:hypothetical protein
MTAKEKAEELVEKHLNTIIDFPYIDTEDGYCLGTGPMTYYSAIRCALIAVNELIKTEYETVKKLLEVIERKNIRLVISFNKEYWQEVKKEIEKLTHK